jgi:hypothetical protein
VFGWIMRIAADSSPIKTLVQFACRRRCDGRTFGERRRARSDECYEENRESLQCASLARTEAFALPPRKKGAMIGALPGVLGG